MKNTNDILSLNMQTNNLTDTRLSKKVADDILRRVIEREFKSGDLLPTERELQDHYQVSRTVIREALKVLAARGVTSSQSGRAAIVNADAVLPVVDALQLALQRFQVSALEVMNVRQLIEPECAALAALNATSAQRDQIRSMAQAFRELGIPDDLDAVWTRLDREFHLLIGQCTQNRVLSILIDVTVGTLWHQGQSRSKPPLSQERVPLATKQHLQIAQSILQYQPDKARRTMEAHLIDTRKHWHLTQQAAADSDNLWTGLEDLQRHPTDLTDAEWMLVEPYADIPHTGGRPSSHSKRAIMNAIAYKVRTNVAWRDLPDSLPPWKTVYDYYRQWQAEPERWEQIRSVLLDKPKE